MAPTAGVNLFQIAINQKACFLMAIQIHESFYKKYLYNTIFWLVLWIFEVFTPKFAWKFWLILLFAIFCTELCCCSVFGGYVAHRGINIAVILSFKCLSVMQFGVRAFLFRLYKKYWGLCRSVCTSAQREERQESKSPEFTANAARCWLAHNL